MKTDSPKDIQERLRRRYLDRLAQRVKRIRKSYLERNWQDLRHESRQLKGSGEGFGFVQLTELARVAETSIPEGGVSKVSPLPEARHAVENLIAGIDAILAENSVYRN